MVPYGTRVGQAVWEQVGRTQPGFTMHGCFSFADNTYVSSSDNDEDVLVTTEPIPVIFHQIATGNLMSQVFYQVHTL